MKRRITRQIYVGTVAIGGDAPIAVQSMTNTKTQDAKATLGQMPAVILYAAPCRIWMLPWR